MGTSTGEGPGTLPRNIFRDDITHIPVYSLVCGVTGVSPAWWRSSNLSKWSAGEEGGGEGDILCIAGESSLGW